MPLDKMTTHYLVTALWSTTDYSDEGRALDDRFDLSDISDEFKQIAIKDCAEIYALISHLLVDGEDDSEMLGHDFWLTRNHHGAGFWDGDYINGDEITKIVQSYFSENDNDLRESIAELNEEETA